MERAAAVTAVVAGTAPVPFTGFVTSQGLFLAQVCAAATAISLSLPVLADGHALDLPAAVALVAAGGAVEAVVRPAG